MHPSTDSVSSLTARSGALQLRRLSREREAELRAEERLRWQQAIQQLTARVEVEKRRLEELSAAEAVVLVPGAAQAWTSIPTYADGRAWHDSVDGHMEAIQRLQADASKELIKAERLKGSFLMQQARIMDLEQLLGERSVEAQRLVAEVARVERQSAERMLEESQLRHQWTLQRQKLDRRLEAAQSSATRAAREGQSARRALAVAHEREVRLLRSQRKRQEETMLRAEPGSTSFSREGPTCTVTPRAPSLASTRVSPAHGRLADSPQTANHNSRRSRSSTPGGVPSAAAKVAALRTTVHRQERSGTHEIQALKSELFCEQQRLRFSLEDSTVVRERHLAVQQISQAEALTEALRTEAQAALGSLPLWRARLEELQDKATLCDRQSLLGPRLRAVGEVIHREPLRDPLESPSSPPSDSFRDYQLQVARASVLRPEIEEELRSAAAARSAQMDVFAEILAERVNLKEELARAEATGHRQGSIAAGSPSHQVVLSQIVQETEEAEDAYQRLRSALVAECQQAQRLHDELLQEQAAQRKRLVDQLQSAGAGTAALPDEFSQDR